MTAFLQSVVQQPAVKHFLIGAAGGALAAAHVDYAAFAAMNSFKDALAYNWQIACFRWVKGAIISGVSAATLGSFTG